jgi:hypothetical protein
MTQQDKPYSFTKQCAKLFLFLTFVGSFLMMVFGSVCLSNDDYGKCGSKQAAIALTVVGTIPFAISCCGLAILICFCESIGWKWWP